MTDAPQIIGAAPGGTCEAAGSPTFREELRRLLNMHSRENRSNTPDMALADFLCACLDAFDAATNQRDSWYGIAPRPGSGVGLIPANDPRPMLCFAHGGSEACEKMNKDYGFTCPKCQANIAVSGVLPATGKTYTGRAGSVSLAWIMEQAKRYDIPLKDCRTVDDCQYREMAWAFRFVAEKWLEEQEEPNTVITDVERK